METLGARIRRLRDNESLSQEELAAQIGIAQSSIGNYERGDRIPDATVLSALADHFKISVDCLIGRTRNEKIYKLTILLGKSEETIIEDLASEALKDIELKGSSFGGRIAALRKMRKISQKQLSQEIGIHQSTYALYEVNKREPNIATIAMLAIYFGVSTDYLFGLKAFEDEFYNGQTEEVI